MFKFHNWQQRILMDKAGEGGSGGGGAGAGQQGGNAGGQGGGGQGSAGAGNQGGGQGQGSGQGAGGLLFDDGGSGTGGGNGNKAGSGQGDAGQGGGTGGNNGNNGGTPNQTVVIPENWKDALPQELKGAAVLEKFKDVGSIIKSYMNLEKMLSADKIAIPQKGAPPEEFRAVLEKLGMPKTEQDYKFDLAQGTQVDKDFFEGFKKQAFALGVFPEQAKALTEWFAKVNDDAFKAQVKAYEDNTRLELRKLEGEWGEAFKENVARAKAALREFASPEAQAFIRDAGLGNNPHLIKMLAKAGELLTEDKIRGEGGSGNNIYTPQQAREKIAELKQNRSHPYWNVDHADHQAAKKEVRALYDMAFPNKTPVKSTTEVEM